MLAIQAIFGIGAFILLAVLCSDNRSLPHWKLLSIGLGLQFAFAFLVFRFSFLQQALSGINRAVTAIASATESGTLFVFGYLGGDPANVSYPFEVGDAGATVILAFRILPLILIFTVLSAILWHYKVLPAIIKGFALLLQRALGVGGAVGFCAAANIFVGMVEAPALIRPHIRSLTRSELFIVMSVGMATIAGTVMILYAVVLDPIVDNALGHILTASVISAPAAITLALIMVPPSLDVATSDIRKQTEDLGHNYRSVIDAITKGTSDGVALMVNVGAMLLVLTALVALCNSILGLLPAFGGEAMTLQRILSYLFAPLVWLMGVPWSEAITAGSLMGIKTTLNEFLAFIAMTNLTEGSLSERSTLIMTYALCGFANFGSLGIMIAGLTNMCKERAEEIVSLAPKSLVSGTLATCMTGSIAGLLY